MEFRSLLWTPLMIKIVENSTYGRMSTLSLLRYRGGVPIHYARSMVMKKLVTIMKCHEMDAGDYDCSPFSPTLRWGQCGNLIENSLSSDGSILDTLLYHSTGRSSPQDPSLVTFSLNIHTGRRLTDQTNRQVLIRSGMNPWSVVHTLLEWSTSVKQSHTKWKSWGWSFEVELVAEEKASSVVQLAGKPKIITDFWMAHNWNRRFEVKQMNAYQIVRGEEVEQGAVHYCSKSGVRTLSTFW